MQYKTKLRHIKKNRCTFRSLLLHYCSDYSSDMPKSCSHSCDMSGDDDHFCCLGFRWKEIGGKSRVGREDMMYDK